MRKSLCAQSSQTEGQLTTESSPADKMISSEALEGVPLLVLANKQDVPVQQRVISPFLYYSIVPSVKSFILVGNEQ